MHLLLPKQFPLFILVSYVCKSLQCLTSTLAQGDGSVHLFRLTCSVVLWGGRNTANISLVCVGSVCSVSATLGLPPLTACVLSQSTLLKLQVALKENSPRQALGFVHFPGLSHSGAGSWVLHKDTDSVEPAFLPFPGPSVSDNQVLGKHTLPRWGSASYHLPSPSRSFSWVLSGSTISVVPCVSSGELISACDPPGRCQPSRIPGRLDKQLGACLQFGRGCHLWG